MEATLVTPAIAGFKYLEHQEEGIRWMMERELEGALWCRGGILGDDMGLGKTWQTIGLLLNAPVASTLIVAPPVLIAQWSAALTQSGIRVRQLQGRKWSAAAAAAASVTLCSYGAIKSRGVELQQLRWDRIILDEGQYIRNRKTARFQSCDALTAERRWILSGTPVQNTAGDFRSLALWLQCDPATLKRGQLSEVAGNIIKRRSITLLAAQLPGAPTHVAHKLEFAGAAEESKFRALVGAVEDAIERQIGGMLILERYLRLQQFISHPQIYVDAMQRKFMAGYGGGNWTGTATKLEKFKELIADVTEPTLVFCHFKQEMDLLGAEATALGYNVAFVRGGLPEKVRSAEIAATVAAAAAGKPTVLFCQIVAGNCGLNLQHLTRVIFYTQHWNPAVIDQALARSYRYGQTKQVTVHHIVLGSGATLNIDRLMLAKHGFKRRAAIDLLPSLEFAYHPEISIEETVEPNGSVAEDPTKV
jgi:transcription termination factor 2